MMSNFVEELSITSYINAHDTYTVYGGSRMGVNVLAAIEELSQIFVDMEELQIKLGNALAECTRNEGAYITNGASAALLLVTAVCMTGGDPYLFSKLPNTRNCKDEIILMKGQRNGYDKAIETAGARIIEIGNADETLAFELSETINPRTAAVFYFSSSLYARSSLALTMTVKIAHERGIPVIVDAAAQLPPKENFWDYTINQGCDLVIFSGGKTLMGPQDSGLILGRRDLIDICRRFGSPNHGICRSSKVSREAMAGLYAAVKQFLGTDSASEYDRLKSICTHISNDLSGVGLPKEVIPYGPVGQSYPRLFIYLHRDSNGPELVKIIKEKYHIFIGYDIPRNALYISPLNLHDNEIKPIIHALQECLLGNSHDRTE
jgi:L-seryl-tRNA(Ser) seleniumtransferase